MVFFGNAPISDRKPGTNVPYTSSVSRIRSGRFFSTSPIFSMVAGDIATAKGLPGLTTKNALIFGSSSFSSSASGYWNL